MAEQILIWGALITGWLWLITAVGQSMYTLAYARWGQTSRWDQRDVVSEWPSAVILMAVRGGGDRLKHCLTALDQLDYPHYTVRIAIDHPQDPAAAIALPWAEVPGSRFSVCLMDAPQTEGGLKCDRLRSLLDRLPGDAQIVAFIDADVVPPRDWLKRLVAPLQDDGVGVVCGNRWYEPLRGSGAETFRVVWNAAAIVQMEWYGIPWGGSMALRRTMVEEESLRETWSRTFCEDTVLASMVRQRQQRVVHDPQLVIYEASSISWREALNWQFRQLLAVRLHHPSWPLVCLHAWNGLLLTVATLVFCLGLMASGQSGWLPLIVSYLIYSLITLAMLQVVAWRNRRPLRAGYLAWCWLWMPVIQLVHSANVIAAIFCKHVRWSQIDYRIERGQVRRLQYKVYRADPQ